MLQSDSCFFLQKVLVWMKTFEDQLATVVDTIANDSDTVKWQISFLTVSVCHACVLWYWLQFGLHPVMLYCWSNICNQMGFTSMPCVTTKNTATRLTSLPAKTCTVAKVTSINTNNSKWRAVDKAMINDQTKSVCLTTIGDLATNCN